jgi:hypothetical protein
MNNLKFYVVNLNMLSEEDSSLDFGSMSNYDFMTIAAKYGEIYTASGFESAINNDDFDAVNSYIRIIQD